MKNLNTESVFPGTRAECVNGPRPCPWIRCKYHLLWFEKFLKYDDRTILKKLFEMPETCVLDVAAGKELSFSEVGAILGRSKQYIHQMDLIKKLRHPSRLRLLKNLYDSDSGYSISPSTAIMSLINDSFDNLIESHEITYEPNI